MARSTLDLEMGGVSRSTWILVDLDMGGVKTRHTHATHTPHTRLTHATHNASHTPHTRLTHATHTPHTRHLRPRRHSMRPRHGETSENKSKKYKRASRSFAKTGSCRPHESAVNSSQIVGSAAIKGNIFQDPKKQPKRSKNEPNMAPK